VEGQGDVPSKRVWRSTQGKTRKSKKISKNNQRGIIPAVLKGGYHVLLEVDNTKRRGAKSWS